MAIPQREQCLDALVEQLGASRVGQDLGLRRLSSFEDLRSSLPVLSALEHEREVETRLGFGLDGEEGRRDAIERGQIERDAVVERWRAELPDIERPRVTLMWGRAADPWVDRIVADDVAAWASEVQRLDRVDDPEVTLQKIQRFEPEVIVAPSLRAVGWLETEFRRPLERALPRLALCLASFDHDARVRSRRPVASAGWVHRAGRVGIPSSRGPARAVTLAEASTIIELLAYTNPEDDARRVYAPRTILPEEANVGGRYELVVSSPLGFVRLRSGEHVRVISFDPPTVETPWPRPRVVRLAAAPMDVALEGCTVAGAWLTASIRQSLFREDPALVAAEIGPDPRSVPFGDDAMQSGSMRLPAEFKETELAWLARTGAHKVAVHRPRGLLVRIELQGFVGRDLPGRLAQRIDESLRRRSPAYDYLRTRDELQPPRVLVLPPNTRLGEQRRRIQELLGPVGGPDIRVVGL